MTVHFIISVGTSIIGNYENKEKKLKPNNKNGTTIPLLEPLELYDRFNDVKIHLEKHPGAEQSSAEKVMKEKNLSPGGCHFHLISTNTRECIFCASYLGHEVFKKSKTDFYLPEKLGSVTDDNFAEKGLPALLSCIAIILDEVEKNKDKAIIIPTGGYKAIIPYLTIAAILYKHPAYYIYEDSDALIQLPAPPLGVDSSAFRPAIVIMENIVGMDVSQSKPYFESLPESFQKLLYENNGKYEYNAFGKRLKKMFEGQPASTLVTRAAGNSLVHRLGKYKETFLSMTRLGETVWIGDKATEMADHARYHHLNLFAYAELLLLPIFHDHEKFLSEEELFLLLGTVYLHDCGHSRCMIPAENNTDVPLLPTEIRNFHNLLGYQRMKDMAFQDSLDRQGLKIDRSTLENIAILSIYHRKKMPLLDGAYFSPDNIQFDAIINSSITQNGKSIRGELLLALFRIIDGMDKQIGRAGDVNEISMKAESILADLGFLKQRIKRLEKLMIELSRDEKTIADEMLNEIFKEYREKEKVSTTDNSSEPRCFCKGCKSNGCVFARRSPSKSEKELPKYIQLKNELKAKRLGKHLALTWEYLDARVRFMFLSLQPIYYYSDLLLKMPKVLHSISDNKRYITINYDDTEKPESKKQVQEVWDAIKIWIPENFGENEPERKVLNAEPDTAKKIAEGIRDEYCSEKYSEVAEILHGFGISVEFQYNGKPVACWQKKDAN